MKSSEVFLIVLLLVCCISLNAQNFGGHPARAGWKHLANDSIDLIYPPAVEKKAEGIFSIINSIPSSLHSPHSIRKLPLVLQRGTIFSNAYVGMGPYRSEFQLTPLQNSFRLGSIPWYELLALHEYRHVQQFDYFNRGISRIIYKILGQEAGGLVNSAAIPNWFWEGDAVWQETRLSTQGRGRLPYFFNEVRSILRSSKQYSYMKWRNGSLRDLVPDHYPLGYLLIGYGTEQFGTDLWNRTVADASRFKPFIYPFQNAFRRYAGISFRQFTREAVKYYRDKEGAPADSLTRWANRQKHFLSNAEFPSWINKEEIIYLRTSYREIPAFYIYNIQTGTNTRIGARRISSDNQFSYRNGRLVYTSYQANKRWSWNDYSVIVIHDLKANSDIEITANDKYFSPDINEAGTRVAAVYVDSSSNSQLRVLDVATRSVLMTMPNPENYFVTYPKFFGSVFVISAVRDNNGRMGILQWNMNTGERSFLLPFSEQVMGFLNVNADTVLFTATHHEKESAFMLLPDRSIRQLMTDPITSLSVYQPALFGGSVALSAISVVGNQLLRFQDSSFKPIATEDLLRPDLKGVYSFRELNRERSITNRSGTGSIPSPAPYRRLAHLFNFHSLRPYISDPDYSISLVSENVLNDFRTELTYLYNRNEGFNQLGFFSTYAGLFPWIRGGVDYTFNRNYLSNGNRIRWDEFQPRIGLSIPWDFSRKYHFRSLRTSLDYVYSRQIVNAPFKDSIAGSEFGYLNPYVSWTNRTQQARQDIYPKFAQSVYIDYRAALNGRSIQQFLVLGAFYFPGLVLNHSIVLQGAYQTRSKGGYRYSNSFPFSRGYSAINFAGMQKFGFNYHFPVAYPDAGVAQIVYFLRVRANPFFDFTRVVNDAGSSSVYKSAGAELYFDTKWWNQESVSFGIRYSRLLDGDPLGRSENQWEIIVPVNLLRR